MPPLSITLPALNSALRAASFTFAVVAQPRQLFGSNTFDTLRAVKQTMHY